MTATKTRTRTTTATGKAAVGKSKPRAATKKRTAAAPAATKKTTTATTRKRAAAKKPAATRGKRGGARATVPAVDVPLIQDALPAQPSSRVDPTLVGRVRSGARSLFLRALCFS